MSDRELNGCAETGCGCIVGFAAIWLVVILAGLFVGMVR